MVSTWGFDPHRKGSNPFRASTEIWNAFHRIAPVWLSCKDHSAEQFEEINKGKNTFNMELSTADQYYLKAWNEYPYNMECMVENLHYALCYDDEHAASWCLMGQIQMFLLKDYQRAKHSYTQALACDLHFLDAYKYLSLLYIWLGQYDKAKRVIYQGMKIPGMDRTVLMIHLALAYEYEGNFPSSKMLLKEAGLLTTDPYWISKIEKELKRIKRKHKCLLKLNRRKKVGDPSKTRKS